MKLTQLFSGEVRSEGFSAFSTLVSVETLVNRGLRVRALPLLLTSNVMFFPTSIQGALGLFQKIFMLGQEMQKIPEEPAVGGSLPEAVPEEGVPVLLYCPFRPGRGRTSLDRISFLARKDFFGGSLPEAVPEEGVPGNPESAEGLPKGQEGAVPEKNLAQGIKNLFILASFTGIWSL